MLALQNKVIPDQLTTVFAAMERDAVERARGYIKDFPPSSPAVALFKDEKVVAMLERHDIEGRTPAEIAQALTASFDRFCSRRGPSIPREEFETIVTHQACGSQIEGPMSMRKALFKFTITLSGLISLWNKPF